MIRKLLLFIIILSLYHISWGQIITQQPVNDSICLGQQEAFFSIAGYTPDITFTWEYSATSTGPWNVTGFNNDTLQITDASNYEGDFFRCSLYNRFSGEFLETSNLAKIIFILPPETKFGINDLVPFSSCNTLCLDTAAQFYDLSQDLYSITAWLWDFGDGSTSVFQNPDHLYLEPGDYTISLTTWNRFGCYSTVQEQVTVIPFRELTITGPDIICGNESSFNRKMYYSFLPYCDTCMYEWKILPEGNVRSIEQISGNTIRIQWDTIETAVQLNMDVIEHNATCFRECLTGRGAKDILLKSQQSPDTAFKIKLKAPGKGILIYLGEDMALYRWGYTDKNTYQDYTKDKYISNFCDYEGILNTNQFEYWVETSESLSGECWTRTLYNE